MTSALAGVPGQRRPDERGPDLPCAVLSLAEAEADAAADALHDGALQALVVARYAADAAVRGADPAAARDAVQHALVALRRAVWLLRPRGDRGLLEALPVTRPPTAVVVGGPGWAPDRLPRRVTVAADLSHAVELVDRALGA